MSKDNTMPTFFIPLICNKLSSQYLYEHCVMTHRSQYKASQMKSSHIPEQAAIYFCQYLCTVQHNLLGHLSIVYTMLKAALYGIRLWPMLLSAFSDWISWGHHERKKICTADLKSWSNVCEWYV